jgi:hypothetical protein
MSTAEDPTDLVPDSVIPHQHLPPLRYRDMPEPVAWSRMVGPSIILAGMALGSGEFILWPMIVYKSGFIFFWAAFLGILTQFFINMEIERWTLLTGESTITGFCRMTWHLSYVMLLLCTVPYIFPGWSTGAAHVGSWLMFGPHVVEVQDKVTYHAWYVQELSIAGLVLCGIILTAGPVVYNTVEQIQTWLVGLILGMVCIIGVMTIRGDAVLALGRGLMSVGSLPDPQTTGLSMMKLLGALAFAGAGGALNLGQSNYVKDKGYGMGLYIGRITSPLTGREETVEETGYHFPHTPENMQRWWRWWRAANIEHFCSFFLTCCITLFLLALIAYSLLYDETGQLKPAAQGLGSSFDFIWAQAVLLKEYPGGQALHLCYLLAGVALLLTTELGILDCVARVAADIVKVNFLGHQSRWSVGGVYFFFLWTEIVLGSVILLFVSKEPALLIEIAAAMNGAVMFLYSMLLLYMNTRLLPRDVSLRQHPIRILAIVWAIAFFGYFTLQSFRLVLWPLMIG